MTLDDKNQKWLFVNKMDNKSCPNFIELYIYKFDSLKLENLQPHLQNPVIINSKTARNGGGIFKYKNVVVKNFFTHPKGYSSRR